MKLAPYIFFGVLFLVFFSGVSLAQEEITLEAGLIEWSEGVLVATDGFDLWYDGQHISGNDFYYDFNSEHYLLQNVSFSSCKKEKPHYKILAKRLIIYEGEKIVFSDVKLVVGSLIIPVPFSIVLEYHEGHYDFPDWLPKIFFSINDGLGFRYTIAKSFFGNLNTVSTIMATTSGKYELSFAMDYFVNNAITIYTDLLYNKKLAADFGVKWNIRQYNLQATTEWSLLPDQTELSETLIEYKKSDWISKLVLTQKSSKIIPLIQIDSPMYQIMGINVKATSGVTQVTESKNLMYHDKIYMSLDLQDRYNIFNNSIRWYLRPEYNLLEGFKANLNIKTGITLKAQLAQALYVGVGYDFVGVWNDLSQTDFKSNNYFNGEIGYQKRNQLKEGWDFKLISRYDLDTHKILKGDLEIVKAFDCFDLKAEVDLVNPTVSLGLDLKY